MADEFARVVFHFDADAALLGVLRTAVQFQASQAGFDDKICAEIAQVSEDVCREAASKLTGADSGLNVTIASYADRFTSWNAPIPMYARDRGSETPRGFVAR